MATYRGFSWYTAWLPSILATYTDVWVCTIIRIIRFISLIYSSILIAKQWLVKEFSIIAGGCMVIACLYLMSIESKKVKMTVITISCLIVCGCIIWTGVELTDISMMIAQVIYVLGHVVLVISTLIVLFRKTRRNDKNWKAFFRNILRKPDDLRSQWIKVYKSPLYSEKLKNWSRHSAWCSDYLYYRSCNSGGFWIEMW